MLRTVSALVVASVLIILPFGARASPAPVWSPPSNVRIVQKDGNDNVRTFAGLDVALASITDASATNRYLIKVMPGSYVSAADGKPYVSIEGSGASQTFIALGSVTQATIKDVTLNINGAPYLRAGAILERVVVQSNYSIGVVVDASDVQIIDSTIQPIGVGYSGPYYGIFQNRGGFSLIRSKVVSPGIALWLSGEGGAPSYPIDIVDSNIEGGTSAIELTAMVNWITVRGSSLKAPSILVADGPYGQGYWVLVATSKLDGSIAGFTPGATRIVHCYDGALNAIPNL